jgi:hypothetical protein
VKAVGHSLRAMLLMRSSIRDMMPEGLPNSLVQPSVRFFSFGFDFWYFLRYACTFSECCYYFGSWYDFK